MTASSPGLGRLAAALALAFALAGCAPGIDASVVSLSGPWAFQPGDDERWADPAFDDGAWPRIDVPRSWGRQGFNGVSGLAWYRLRVPGRWPATVPLGITFGKVDSAYEIYVGGQRVGAMGRMPPNPAMMFDRHGTYAVPASALAPDGSFVIAVRVWRAPGMPSGSAGLDEGPFEAGPLADVTRRAALLELPQLVLVVVFLFAAAYHLVLGVLHPGTDEYGWFGALVLEAALYGFLRTQWKYSLLDDFILLKKAEHVVLYLIQATMLQFLWVYFRQRRPPWGAMAEGAILTAAVAVVVAPGVGLAFTLIPFLYAIGIFVALMGLAMAATHIVRGDRAAIFVGFGLLALTAALTNDALVERNRIMGPRIGLYGFAVLVMAMGLSLVLRFRRAVTDLDTLRLDLENRVEQRTRELSGAYRAMAELALRDGLTQLLNRRALQERAIAGLGLANRRGQPFALAMVDIDHFKAINDTHGHGSGDQVLAQMARCLSGALRVSDDVGRWGGEEFLVLFGELDHPSAIAAAERLRLSVEGSPFRVDGGAEIRVTVSIGVASVAEPTPAASVLEALIREADDALYRAKASGRNRVVGSAEDLTGSG